MTDNPFGYSDRLMQTFEQLKYDGEIDNPTVTVTKGSMAIGQSVKFMLKIEDGIITDGRFKAFGSTATIACASFAIQWLIGKTIEEASTFSSQRLIETFELSMIKRNSALFVADAIHQLLKLSK